ncbi:MAG: ATP-binding protein [Caulobacteraceae bacterium]
MKPYHSDRSRLAAVSASAALLIGAGFFVAVSGEHEYRDQATAVARSQARVLAETVSAALSFGDRAALGGYVSALESERDVDAVGVYDDKGRLAARSTRSHLADRLERALGPRTAPDRIIVTAPVVQSGTRLGTVYVRDKAEPLSRRLDRYAGAALLIAMALMMFMIMALDSRSLRQANRDLVKQMAEREKAEEALRQSQKMEAVGRLTGGIAHDFNNMLAVVIGNLDLLIRRKLAGDADAARLAGNALEGAQRARGLTQRLLAFSRLQPLKPASVDVARVVRDTTELIRRTLGEAVVVEAVSGGGLWRAHIDAAQLESTIVNLAINARDAMPDGGKLTIETSNVYLDRSYAADEIDLTAGQYVMLAVTDTGCGMTPDVLAQVFEPFFTTKGAGLGTGLGLSQVHGFIKQSGGHIRIYTEVGVGTTVKLYLPRSTDEAPHGDGSALRLADGGRRGVTVLLVEDEDGVRRFAREALDELGFDVIAASGAAEALELLAANPSVTLMLTDVVMPEVNGRVLAETALARSPGLKVVFMTGYTRNAIVHNGVLDADTHLVSKPFTVTELGEELEAALAKA